MVNDNGPEKSAITLQQGETSCKTSPHQLRISERRNGVNIPDPWQKKDLTPSSETHALNSGPFKNHSPQFLTLLPFISWCFALNSNPDSHSKMASRFFSSEIQKV